MDYGDSKAPMRGCNDAFLLMMKDGVLKLYSSSINRLHQTSRCISRQPSTRQAGNVWKPRADPEQTLRAGLPSGKGEQGAGSATGWAAGLGMELYARSRPWQCRSRYRNVVRCARIAPHSSALLKEISKQQYSIADGYIVRDDDGRQYSVPKTGLRE